MGKRPSAERQGGTVAPPTDHLAQVVAIANRWKATSNDLYAELLAELAQARSESAQLKAELQSVTAERDQAREQLAELRVGGDQ